MAYSRKKLLLTVVGEIKFGLDLVVSSLFIRKHLLNFVFIYSLMNVVILIELAFLILVFRYDRVNLRLACNLALFINLLIFVLEIKR